jgi:hypothetical protein
MKVGDQMLIEFEMGDMDCDPVWAPLVDCNGQVKLVYPKSFLLLPLALKYRAVMTDSEGLFMTDPSHFSTLLIQGVNLNEPPVLQNYYHGCNGDVSGGLADCCDDTPIGPGALPYRGYIGG